MTRILWRRRRRVRASWLRRFREVTTSRGWMEFRVPTCQRVIIFFLLVIRVEAIVWILVEFTVVRGGGVLEAKTKEELEEFSARRITKTTLNCKWNTNWTEKQHYQGDAMFSRGWSSKEAPNGCRNNVVERVTIPSVEKPDAWNSCITNPRERRKPQSVCVDFQTHRSLYTFLITPALHPCNVMSAW